MKHCPLSLVSLALLIGCSSGGGGGGGGAPMPAPGPSQAPPSGSSPGGAPGPAQPAPAAVSFARLEADYQARKQAYLQGCATGTHPGGEGLATQISRLETGIGPLSRPAIEASLDKMERREDTADFGANLLIRILYLHGANPLIPTDLRQRADRTFLAFKYAVDEPGQDDMVFWSENHRILFATVEYLAGHFYPQQTFSNAGVTGLEHARRARPAILRWLDARMRFGFSEWHSPVYYEEDLAPLFNLADFAPDADIRDRAAIVLDLMLFDLARLTHRGSFGVSSGRAYEEHKLSGRGQSVGDTIEVLFGTRGGFNSRGSMSATSLASSRRYRVPHALLGIGRDVPAARAVDRARLGLSFAEAGLAGFGFSTLEDCLFWWGMGAYMAPETIVLSRQTIDRLGLWHYGYFQPLSALRLVPDALLPFLSSTLSPLSEGSVLSTASHYTFRTPDAMLASVQRYRPGQVGFQQHAWQATLDQDALVFTTAPGLFGRDGPGTWTGSTSLPHVVQVEDVALILYNPPEAIRAISPRLTHAFFPRAGFDEVVTGGSWTFGRKGDGYVALFSALPATWASSGTYVGRELVANGSRNVWICQVGRAAEDGSFADFMAAVSGAPVAVAGAGEVPFASPLTVRYEAPGIGVLEAAFRGTPTRSGAPIPESGYPRFENPYATVPFGARQLRIAFAGAVLDHDHDAGTRSGDGL